tara:strand:- start:77 stop:277 length:201 start_codon:yes stop_codon:yes gene_type:complete
MARTSFGSGIGEGKVETIGDNRYGLRETYDDAEMKKTKEHYRKGDTLTIKEVKNPLLQTVKTVKAK